MRFTAYAWAKLIYFRDRGPTEIGGFGVTAEHDPMLIEDFVTVRQRVGAVTVEFDDLAVADYFEAQVDAGRRPDRFARIWLHSHPGTSPEPSCVDEETFARVFGRCDWAVMFIIARGGATYARLRFGVGPGGQIQVPVEVDYTAQFDRSNHAAWAGEYEANVSPVTGRIAFPLSDPPDAVEPPYEEWDAGFLDALDDAQIGIEMEDAMEALGDPWSPGDALSEFDLDVGDYEPPGRELSEGFFPEPPDLTGEHLDDVDAFDRQLDEHTRA